MARTGRPTAPLVLTDEVRVTPIPRSRLAKSAQVLAMRSRIIGIRSRLPVSAAQIGTSIVAITSEHHVHAFPRSDTSGLKCTGLPSVRCLNSDRNP